MIIILEGVSGTGKSTLSRELQKALCNRRESYIIAHPSKDSFYGNLTRELITLKHKVQNNFLQKIIDPFIGIFAVEDFKNSLKLAKENPDIVYIWERSPLSTLVYNTTSKIAAKILVPKVVALNYPPETKWILLSDINYKQLIQRLNKRNRDAQDLNCNRSLLIEQTIKFTIYLKGLAGKPFFNEFNSIKKGLLWELDTKAKIQDIINFITLKDTYLFF